MSYVSITELTTFKAFEHIEKHCAEGAKQILAPPAYLILMPATLITQIIDLVIGIFATLATLFTCAKKEAVIGFTTTYLQSGSLFLSVPYFHLLKILNPSLKIDTIAMDEGLLNDSVMRPLVGWAEKSIKSDNPFNRQVTSRLCFLLASVASLVVGVIDTVIGVLAAAFALLALGRWNWMNKIAVGGLTSFGIGVAAMLLGIVSTVTLKKLFYSF